MGSRRRRPLGIECTHLHVDERGNIAVSATRRHHEGAALRKRGRQRAAAGGRVRHVHGGGGTARGHCSVTLDAARGGARTDLTGSRAQSRSKSGASIKAVALSAGGTEPEAGTLVPAEWRAVTPAAAAMPRRGDAPAALASGGPGAPPRPVVLVLVLVEVGVATCCGRHRRHVNVPVHTSCAVVLLRVQVRRGRLLAAILAVAGEGALKVEGGLAEARTDPEV